jgi:hypothetical protein
MRPSTRKPSTWQPSTERSRTCVETGPAVTDEVAPARSSRTAAA